MSGLEMLILVFTFLLTLSATLAAGPTLEDLQKIKCPQEKPYICLQYGHCCGGDEYCHQGECVSCFPTDLPGADLLTWCREFGQHNVTLMRDASACRLACHFRFNASEMQTCDDWSNSSCPKKCPSGHCCQDDQFCSGDQCQSCFPDHLSVYDLASWCRETVNDKNTSWKHPSCKYACYARFTPAQISATNGTMIHWIIGVVVIVGVILAVLICTSSIRPVKKQVSHLLSKFTRSRNPEKMENITLVPEVVIEDKVPDSEEPFLIDDNEPAYNKKLERSLSTEERRQDSYNTAP